MSAAQTNNEYLRRIAGSTTGGLSVGAVSNFPATVDTNDGNSGASTLRVVLSTDQPTMTNPQPIWQKQRSGVPSSVAILSADGTVFTLAAGEVGFIQNLSADAPLAVKYGASASTSSLNLILAASTADSDGTGGAIKIDDWIGAVSVAKMTGTAKYLAYKIA